MKLTIGMAHFDDYHGAIFTIQSIRMTTDFKNQDIEIIVIDNSPQSQHGKMLKDFCGKTQVRYIATDTNVGTTSRQFIFDNATGDAVLCMDCHVLLKEGSISKLIEFYKNNPNTKNLYTGPLLLDSLNSNSTHFDLLWRGQMWGIWGYASECKNCKYRFSHQGQGTIKGVTEDLYLSMETQQKNLKSVCPSCGENLKDSIYNRVNIDSKEPFQIPAQGLGLFTCMKNAWLGFNPNFEQFGGEEGYIHHKYANAGHKTMCLPFLQWWHRFGRPDGAPYPLSAKSKIKNYIHGFTEVGLPLEEIKAHFINEGTISEKQWIEIGLEVSSLNNKSVPVPIKQPKSCNVQPQSKCCKNNQQTTETKIILKDPIEIFNHYKTEEDEFIHGYFSKAKSVAIYSDTANAFFNAMACSNLEQISMHHKEVAVSEGIKDMAVTNSAKIEALGFDSLFSYLNVDVLYSAIDNDDAALKRVLSYNRRVGRYIFSTRGLNKDFLNNFMKAASWKVADTKDNFIVLERGKGAMLPVSASSLNTTGPGTELSKILKFFGIKYTPSCACSDKAKVMDSVGEEWCKAHMENVIIWLKQEADKRYLINYKKLKIKMPFWKFGAKLLIRFAIYKSERKNKRAKTA